MHEAESRLARYSPFEVTLIVQFAGILDKLCNPKIACDKDRKKLLSRAAYSRYQDLRSLGLEGDAQMIIAACQMQKSRNTQG